VFIVKDDKAVETAVTAGAKIGDQVEVREASSRARRSS